MHEFSAEWAVIDRSDGVRLRRLIAADAGGVLSVHGDPRVYVHDPHETQSDLADAETFLRPLLQHWAEHGFGYWTVLVPRAWWTEGVGSPRGEDEERVHAGLGGIHHHRLGNEPVFNVYFRLAPAVQGRGLAGHIVRTAQAIAPTIEAGRDLVVRTRPANMAARRVAERSGFEDLGLEPGATDMQLLRWRSGTSLLPE